MKVDILLSAAGIGNQLCVLRNAIMFCLSCGIQDLEVTEHTVTLKQHANFVPLESGESRDSDNIKKIFFKSCSFKLDISEKSIVFDHSHMTSFTSLFPYHSFEHIRRNVGPGNNYFAYCPEEYRDIMKEVWTSDNIVIHRELVRKYMRDIFCINAAELNPLSENELIIHIRSGDLFDDSDTTVDHKESIKGYIVPPLSYYKKVIESNNYDKIYIVAQDKGNPCVEELLKTYPNVSLSSHGLEADIELILAAKHICASVGSFVSMLQDLTDNTTRIYYPSFAECSFISDTSANIRIDIDKPGDRYGSKFIGGWLNTKEQRDIILNWELP